MSRPSPPAAHSITACPVSNLRTAQGTSALHVPGRIPFGTATVTAYARPSRFVDVAASVRAAASQVSSVTSMAPCTTCRVVPITNGRGEALGGRQVAALDDLHSVDERLVGVRNLAEHEVRRPPGRDRWQREARKLPVDPGVVPMPRLAPTLRHRNRLPRRLVEFPSAVGGVVPGSEAPALLDREHVATGDDGRCDIPL